MQRSHYKQSKAVVDIVINENKDEHGLTETKLSFFFFLHVDNGSCNCKRENQEIMGKALLRGWFPSVQENTRIWFEIPH